MHEVTNLSEEQCKRLISNDLLKSMELYAICEKHNFAFIETFNEVYSLCPVDRNIIENKIRFIIKQYRDAESQKEKDIKLQKKKRTG